MGAHHWRPGERVVNAGVAGVQKGLSRGAAGAGMNRLRLMIQYRGVDTVQKGLCQGQSNRDGWYNAGVWQRCREGWTVGKRSGHENKTPHGLRSRTKCKLHSEERPAGKQKDPIGTENASKIFPS